MRDLQSYNLQTFSEYEYIGRRMNPMPYPLPLVSNATGIEIYTDSTEVWLDIEIDYDVWEPWAYTTFDDAVMSRQMLTKETHEICICRNLNPGRIKKLGFFRENQASFGDDRTCIYIKAIRANGNFFPVAKKPLKIEFIGDSLTSGEGTYGVGDSSEYLPMFMSATHDYAKLTADIMNAEFHVISQGGWGVVSGWNNDPKLSIPRIYEQVYGLAMGEVNERLGTLAPYDFAWSPDYVVINLGTNDLIGFGAPAFTDPETGISYQMRLCEDGNPNEEDIERLRKGIVGFLRTVRERNPKAQIVWSYGLLKIPYAESIEDGVNRYITESGDTKVHICKLPEAADDELLCRLHPGYTAHVRAARVLAECLHNIR